MSAQIFPPGISLGLPAIPGQWFHVCPGSASILGYGGKQIVGSSSNDGLSLETALDSINTAYNNCTSGAGDGIILWSFGTTTAACTSYLSAALTWAKHGITVVGVCAPTAEGQRARISNLAASTGLANLITVSGNNNHFYNLQALQGGIAAGALGCIDVSGLRNYFYRVNILNTGAASQLLTGSYSLNMVGPAEDNLFEECVIGQNTVDQDGSQAVTGVLKFTGTSGGASGNVQANFFKRCHFKSYLSYASSACGMIHHVGSGDSIDRTQLFEDCLFSNFKLGLPTTTPPLSLVVGTAPNNGVLWMTGKTAMLGYAAYDSVAANDRVFVSVPAANATGGLAVVTA